MYWTRHGLTGRTPNSHRLAIVPLSGQDRGRLTVLDNAELDAFWSSPDGEWQVFAKDKPARILSIRHGSATVAVPIVIDDPRSVALSVDRKNALVASWTEGTRAVNIDTGESRILLAGHQTWIALSQNGNLAWATENEGWPGTTCVLNVGNMGL
jgi:hypothetical protein